MVKKVLIADDSYFMRQMLKNIINEIEGFEVISTASDGREAVEKYIDLKPDIVTMDITMPYMSGIEALKEITKINPQANVIMVSAMGQYILMVEAAKVGAKAFITKPFSKKEIIKTLMSFKNKDKK